jgi:hypothetical protein
MSEANMPSVIPTRIGDLVVNAIRNYQNLLNTGVLLILDEKRIRARILPINPGSDPG